MLRDKFFTPNEFGKETSTEEFGADLFWDEAETCEMSATIEFLTNKESYTLAGTQFSLIEQRVLRAELKAWHYNDRVHYFLLPLANVDGSWKLAGRIDNRGSIDWLGGNNAGHQDTEALCRHLFQDFAGRMYFFDAVRALDRGGNRSDVDDGSRLLRSLHGMAHSAAEAKKWNRFRRDLVTALNEILRPAGIPQIERLELPLRQSDPLLHLYSGSRSDVPIEIHATGTGMMQLVILVAAVIRARGTGRVFFLEEPELNLHPALVRGLIRLLRKEEAHQFIVTTHSNVLIDEMSEHDKTFRFAQDADTLACKATCCREVVDLHGVLDALGVTGSTLLQSNCAIWVEGPSDRLYLRRWLQLASPHLSEGRDYTFVFYGGSVLAHFSFDLDCVEDADLVQILRLSRFSIVLCDQDEAVEDGETPLARRKMRVLMEAANDPMHRLCCTTVGREIENDVPGDVFAKAISELLKNTQLASKILPSTERFSDFYAELISSSPSEIKSVTKKLQRSKIKLAQFAIENWDSEKEYAPPAYVNDCIRLIARSSGRAAETQE